MNRGGPILTAAQMRWADEETMRRGVSGFELMDRAGEAVAHAVLELEPDTGRVLIVTGPGNNGGDGFAAARHLLGRRAPVTVVPLVPIEALKGEAAEHARLALAEGVKVREPCVDGGCCELERWLTRAIIVVDAVFGTGLSRPLEGRMAKAVELINRAHPPVLAVDIASGLDTDNGRLLGACIDADWTLPIATTKWGHWLADGCDRSGEILEPADIGISSEVIEQSWTQLPDAYAAAWLSGCHEIVAAWPARPRHAHKGDFGHLWIFGGSVGYSGAPRLAGLGGMAAGAGLVSIACPQDLYAVMAASSLEMMVHPEARAPWQRANAIVAGPGWGVERAELLRKLVASDRKLVIDADGLNIVAGDDALAAAIVRRPHLTVLTPHPGEAARLLGCASDAIQQDRRGSALALAERFGCWIVLKGAGTLVVSPDRRIYLSPYGSPRLAVGGTGDVLAGMIGALLAGGRTPEIALPAAVALHGKAGEQPGWYLAGELAGKAAALRQSVEAGDSAW